MITVQNGGIANINYTPEEDLNVTVESGGVLNVNGNPSELVLDSLTVTQIRLTSESDAGKFVHIFQSQNDITANRFVSFGDCDGIVKQEMLP